MKNLNKVELAVIFCILTVVFGIMTNWFSWAVYAMWGSILYVIGFSIVMFYNMIKNL